MGLKTLAITCIGDEYLFMLEVHMLCDITWSVQLKMADMTHGGILIKMSNAKLQAYNFHMYNFTIARKKFLELWVVTEWATIC